VQFGELHLPRAVRRTTGQGWPTAGGRGKVRGARREVVKCEVPVQGKLWLVGG